MAISFKVRCPTVIDIFKVDQIAKDCGAKTSGFTLQSDQRKITVLTHDDAQALRALFRELGYQTSRID